MEGRAGQVGEFDGTEPAALGEEGVERARVAPLPGDPAARRLQVGRGRGAGRSGAGGADVVGFERVEDALAQRVGVDRVGGAARRVDRVGVRVGDGRDEEQRGGIDARCARGGRSGEAAGAEVEGAGREGGAGPDLGDGEGKVAGAARAAVASDRARVACTPRRRTA